MSNGRPSHVICVSVFAAALVLAAGCGGDGGSSVGDGSSGPATEPESAAKPVATSSLDKAEFVKSANGICGRRKGDWRRGFKYWMKENPPKGGETRSDVQVAGIKTIAVPTLEVQTREIRELGAPQGDQAKVGEVVAAFERANADGAHLKEPTGRDAVYRGYVQAGLLAKRYGMDECAFPDGW